MTKCRATTFYLAPGIYCSFDTHAIYTKLDGSWVELTHRKDVERLDASGDWDGQCHIVHRNLLADNSIDNLVKKRPEHVERWKLCARTINGRRPAGVEHMLHKIANNGAAHTGGIRACVGAVLGSGTVGKQCARWFESQPDMPASVQAAALKYLQHANSALDDNEMQSLIAAMERTRCIAPMPEYAHGQIRELTFLQRWPSATRVKLLADLWQRGAVEATGSYIRVAQEMLVHPDPNARRRAQQTLQEICTSSAALTEAAIRDQECGDVAKLPLGAAVVANLAATPKWRHTVALHPNNPVGQTLRAIADSGDLEHHELAMPDPAPELAGDVLDTIEALLESRTPPHAAHTHSRTKAENMFVLALVLAQRRPASGHHVATTFATWTRCRGAQTDGADWGLRAALGDHNIELDADTTGRLWKTVHELAVKRQQRANVKNPNHPTPFHQHGIVELASLLEQQADAPPAIREHARQWCADNKVTYRDTNGRLIGTYRYLEQQIDTGNTAALIAHIETAATSEDRVQQSAAILRDAAARGADDTTWDTLTANHAALVDTATGTTWARRLEMERTSNREHVAALNHARGVVRGTISEPELAAHGEHIKRVGRTGQLGRNVHALTPHTRAWLLEQNRDTDLLLLENALSGHTTVVTSRQVPQIEQRLSDAQTLNERTDVVWPDKPKRFNDLPNFDAVEWDLPDAADQLQGHHVNVDDVTFDIRVIDNYHELKQNAAPNNMGNCTDGYARDIRYGDTLMLALQQHGRTEINVSVEVATTGDRQAWQVTEIKGRRNTELGASMEETITSQLHALLRHTKRPATT